MTDQELKEILADLIVSQKDTAQSIKDTAQSIKDTDRILKEFAQRAEKDRKKIEEDLAEERRKTEETQRRLAEELAEDRRRTEEERRKTEQEQNKTENVIAQVNKQLGELGNKFGSFTEGMALPSMEKIFYRDFKMDVVSPRAKARQNGESLEIDVLAYDNGSRNEAYLVEVKSHLTLDGIEQILKTIEKFPKFFGTHRHRTIYGVIAAVDIPDNMRAEVIKQGLYLARIHDGEFELLTPPGFRPAPFGPDTQLKNGKQ